MPRKVRRITAAGRANRPRAGDGNLAARHRWLQGETAHHAAQRAIRPTTARSNSANSSGSKCVFTLRRMISMASS